MYNIFLGIKIFEVGSEVKGDGFFLGRYKDWVFLLVVL